MSINDHARSQQLSLPAGYLIGEFEMAEQVTGPDATADVLMSVLLLADQRINGGEREHLPQNWTGLRNRAGAMLIAHMTDEASGSNTEWFDGHTVWSQIGTHHARRQIPSMDNAALLTLFVQASENAYLFEAEPNQVRWQKIVARCYDEILRRIAIGGADQPIATDRSTDAPLPVSMREALRVAEEALRPQIPDAALLDVYVLVAACREPDGEFAFDEIVKAAGEMLFQRMERGSPDQGANRYAPPFDFEDMRKSFKVVRKGTLPHKYLVMLYSMAVSFSMHSQIDHDAGWWLIAALSRAQVLGRMNPPCFQGDCGYHDRKNWERSELVRRVLSHRRAPQRLVNDAFNSGGAS